MCGICGIALCDRDLVVSRGLLLRMANSMAHRGPDDIGVLVRGPVGIAHRRLSIVDLQGGHQPMANEDGSVWITYNGEIYNHADFQSGLGAAGHRYRTRCDTEVLIHLYEEDGHDFLADVRGMFALAIWDQRDDSILLARDRLGVKPLYYVLSPSGDLVFASEVKALFASGLVEPELDERLLAEYFATGGVAGARTLFRGVHELRPGHLLRWRSGAVQEICYWKLPDRAVAGADSTPRRLQCAAREFWSLFQDAVRSRLMSDVPLGVFLSGGLDSSLIVAAMRECAVDRLATFSVGVGEVGRSELPAARAVAEAFDTDHHEVAIDSRRFFEALPQLTWKYDFPITFPASVPLYFVSELAARAVKVVLTGEGCDELFAGYGRYPRALWNLRFGRVLDATLPGPLRLTIARAKGRLGDGYVSSRIRRSFLVRRGAFEDAYLEAFAGFDDVHRAGLLKVDGIEDPYEASVALLDRELLIHNPVEAMLRFDQGTYLQDLLTKQDRMSMAASLESRVPYLDHALVEWAAGLVPGLKLRRSVGKNVVRAAAREYLPDGVIRAGKRGFPVPLGEWFRGYGRQWLEEYAPDASDEVLDGTYVRCLIERHLRGADHSARLWLVLAFQVWRRHVLEVTRAGGSADLSQGQSA